MALAEIVNGFNGWRGNFVSRVKGGVRPAAEEVRQPRERPVVERSDCSPWEVLESQHPVDRQVSEWIRDSFNPSIPSGERPMVEMVGAGRYGYLCEALANGEAGIWLDPTIWAAALKEFAVYAGANAIPDVYFLVMHHANGVKPEHDYIQIMPIVREGKGRCRVSELDFILKPNGLLSVGNKKASYNLGPFNLEQTQVE